MSEEVNHKKDDQIITIQTEVPKESVPIDDNKQAETELNSVEVQPEPIILQPILERLNQLDNKVTELAQNMQQLIGQADLLPRQVRQLGAKINDITESLSQPRIRDLLNSYLMLFDLLDQMIRTSQSESESQKSYIVLRDQISQVLHVNGVFPITDVEKFNPVFHKVIKTVECENEPEDGQIVEVYRSGFRTERAILRYSEVVVKQYRSKELK